jgi:uncharacterized OB-fold protein
MSTPARYWREIPQRYRYEANKCSQCGKINFPPRLICPECQGREFETTKLAERGKVLTYTIIRVAPQQFVDQVPFAVGIIELEDGVRLMGQIVDCDIDLMKIGQKVKLEFRKIYDVGESGVICYGYKFVPEM